MRGGALRVALLWTVIGALGAAPASAARPPTARWLPNPANASWTYSWSDDAYAPKPTLERYTVGTRSDTTVRLNWSTDDPANGDGTVTSQGTMDYVYSNTGLVNTNWSSSPPPSQFPVLCAQAGNCGNSLAGVHYMLIWGSRSPVMQEPIVRGASWTSTGGQNNDVGSSSRYVGVERVTVPAFPLGVLAAKVVSDITQAGAIGDPYGSGVRTVWWVFGVGPVKILLQHAGGDVSRADLESTNQVPQPTPSDLARLPLRQGQVMRYRYTNSRYMKTPSRQEFTVGAVVNNTARVDVRELSGPIKVRGSYVFATGLDGVTNLSVTSSAATKVKFPKLGPKSLPAAKRRRFFTPFDLMTFGLNPIVPAFPVKKQTWTSEKASRDRAVFGVTGSSTVIGDQVVRTPAGRYTALLVQSKLRQNGFPFGSGVRRAWFAPGVGLVKLTFKHADGSTSTVERLP